MPAQPSNIDASTAPPAEPESGTDDHLRYLDTLRELGSQGAAVNTALLEAHMVDAPSARQAALSQLHTRLRRMAATANQALGGWTDEAGDTQ